MVKHQKQLPQYSLGMREEDEFVVLDSCLVHVGCECTGETVPQVVGATGINKGSDCEST